MISASMRDSIAGSIHARASNIEPFAKIPRGKQVHNLSNWQ